MDTKPKKKSKSKRDPSSHNPNELMKYSGMAIQWAAIMGLGVFVGKWLDARYDTEPYLLLVMTLISLVAGFYLTLKDFIFPKEK